MWLSDRIEGIGPSRKTKWRGIYILVLILGLMPILKFLQYKYVPVITEFQIKEVIRVEGPYTFQLHSIPKIETIEVPSGFILEGEMRKSSLYPKSICTWTEMDITEQVEGNLIADRVQKAFGDQPHGSTETRRIGMQRFHSWYFETNSSPGQSVELTVDIRHTCAVFFGTLQRVTINIDGKTLEATHSKISSIEKWASKWFTG